MPVTEMPVADLVRIVRSEYHESPGLNLTKAQMQRLWSIDRATCEAVLHTLLKAGFLRRTATDAYVRVDAGR